MQKYQQPKKSKIRLMALALGTGFAFAAFAGSKAAKTTPPLLGTNYTLQTVITNVPAPVVAAVSGTPVFADFGSNSTYGIVYTDGSGKLDGVEDMIFTNLQLCPPFVSGDFITEIGGSITTSGKTNNVIVTMTMKGNGYVQNSAGSTQAAASLNLSFTGKLFSSNSFVNVTTTNTFLVISTNYGQTVGFTNEYTYLPVTNYVVSPASQSLEVLYYTEQSFSVTNTAGGTNTTLVQNGICSGECFVNFGTPTGTTNFTTFQICNALCTNVFTNVVIGTNITFAETNYVFGTATNVINATTNYVYGLNISNLEAFMVAVTNCVSTNGTGYVQLVVAVITNMYGGFGYTNAYTYAFVDQFGNTNSQNISYSNSWFEVDGALKGKITAGRCKQSFDNTNASLSGSYYLFTAMVGSGSNTSGPYFGTNKGALWVATNDSGVFYVVSEFVLNSDLGPVTPLSGLSGTVKQAGNNIWISTGGNFLEHSQSAHPNARALAGYPGGGFIGSGSQTPKKGTYKVNMTGLGRLSGSSLVLTGATGIDIIGYTALTNIVAISNLAAIPPVAGFATNTNYFYGSMSFFVPTQVIAGQVVGRDSYYDYFSLVTNGVGTTNVIVTNNWICALPVAPMVVTNTVNCIRTVFGNGKILGQKISGSGTNADAAYPVRPPS